ncbi:MAG TPA: hypothetical protein VJ936_05470 [Desulfobacteraceae bacterium]|nr:hypothetical protein [Desulfobacteraceae bacterium]
MYVISFYVPETHLQGVKQALFDRGAGKIGHYDSCAWQTKGRGQFRPLDGSSPFSGKQDRISQVDEYKVEMVCSDDVIAHVIKALHRSHPYEQPAYHVIKTAFPAHSGDCNDPV